MKRSVKILAVVVVVLIVIQFFPPTKNVSEAASAKNISAVYNTPAEVKTILDKACNDCHSNNTVYPWYAEVQPVAWWLNEHIEDGKKDLNFSEFASYRPRRQYKKLEEINELVKENEMPLNSYLWIHKDAKLSDQQKLTLANWVEATRDSLEARYPIDSLVRKK